MSKRRRPTPPSLNPLMNSTQVSSSGSDLVIDNSLETKTNIPEDSKINIEKTISFLGNIRDFVIAVGGSFVIVGFLFLQLSALRLNLGFIAASPVQYMLAGWFPVVMIGITALLWFIGKNIAVYIASHIYASEKIKKYYDVISFILVVCLIIGVYFVLKNNGSDRGTLKFSNAALYSLFLMFSSYIVGIYCAVPYSKPVEFYKKPIGKIDVKFNRAVASVSILLFPVFFFVAMVKVYGDTVYLGSVQEFGGLKPRMAYLDVSRIQMSPETRSILLPKTSQSILEKKIDDVRKDPTPVVRTILLDVAYDAGDYLLVRPHGSPVTPTYRLKKDVIQNIEWWGYIEPKK